MSQRQETPYSSRVTNVEQRPAYQIDGIYHISIALNAIANKKDVFAQAWVTANDGRKIVAISGDREVGMFTPQEMTSHSTSEDSAIKSVMHLLLDLKPEDFSGKDHLTLRAHVLNMNPENPITEEIEIAKLKLKNNQTIDINVIYDEEKVASDLENIRKNVVVKKNGDCLIVDLTNCDPGLKQILKDADIYFIDSRNYMISADKLPHSSTWQQEISGLDNTGEITVKLFIDKNNPIRGVIATTEPESVISA